ncbi:MAG: hypothetical protein ACXVZP_09590, partial [Gaiellaceae bacterium]
SAAAAPKPEKKKAVAAVSPEALAGEVLATTEVVPRDKKEKKKDKKDKTGKKARKREQGEKKRKKKDKKGKKK